MTSGAAFRRGDLGIQRASFLDPVALASADIDRWRELASQAVSPNPFFEPSFLLPAVRGLRGRHIRLLVARDRDGAWIGTMPVRRALRWRRLPGPVLDSWQHRYSYLGAPLLATGQETAALAVLLRTARRRVGLVALEQLPDDVAEDVVGTACENFGVAPVIWSRADRALLRRRADPADYVLLRGKRRRELRRQRTALARELGGELTTTDLAGDGAAVDRFLVLEDAGWKGQAGTSMTGAGADGFFKQVCANFAAAGRLKLLALGTGDRTVAMKCNLIAGDGVFCFKIAHDPAFARSSPGVQLELDNIEHFHEHSGLAWMDSCADPNNQMINRIWPDRQHLRTVLVPSGGIIGRVGRAEAALAADIRHRLKERNP